MKKQKAGYIYFIAEQGSETYIKIGFSTLNPQKRLKNLQTGNPRILEILASFEVDDCQYYEKLVHKDFAFIRKSGEWFLRTKKIDKFLELAKEYGFYRTVSYFVGGKDAVLIADKNGIKITCNYSYTHHGDSIVADPFSESNRYHQKTVPSSTPAFSPVGRTPVSSTHT